MDERALPKPPPLTGAQSVLLDFDGTLVEIAARPTEVFIDPGLATLLHSLVMRQSGRVAIVSGRPIDQLQDMLGDCAKVLTLIGSHGAELKIVNGSLMRPPRPAALAKAADVLSKAFADHVGVLVENKSLGVAVHYRLAPSAEPEVRAILGTFARENGLAIQEGKMMIELRLSGHDKGSAIAALLRHPSFLGHPAVFLGDDLTDESGFAVCESNGGAGILVGAQRPTAARYRLDDVLRVREWLAGKTA
ncbi:trehalose-phosphatase [Rhabdaerophilum sp. SD176]|uniref:trehalose-phosphatase n=1 Tax=Rhabdaerophilum sp. SD176 TaxID=2983548 RepID=UPI0024DF4935|nr:trehalose-phosphatase [Rhabdaerophilum sp. SD176]